MDNSSVIDRVFLSSLIVRDFRLPTAERKPCSKFDFDSCLVLVVAINPVSDKLEFVADVIYSLRRFLISSSIAARSAWSKTPKPTGS